MHTIMIAREEIWFAHFDLKRREKDCIATTKSHIQKGLAISTNGITITKVFLFYPFISKVLLY